MSNKSSRKNSAKQPIKKKDVKKGSSRQPQQQEQQQQNAKVNVVETTKSKIQSSNAKGNVNSSKVKKEVVESVPKKEAIAAVEVPPTKKAPEEPKKLERSNSFIGTLSKFYNKLSESVENLTKIVKEPETASSNTTSSMPFKFQRSLTLNSFQFKKSNRKSLLENPRLEKLSEEKISEGKIPSTPPKSPSPPPVTLRSRSPTNYRQTMPVGSFDHVDFTREAPPILKRSDSFIQIIKRKISFNDSKPLPPSPPPSLMEKTASSTNLTRNWAMSLQNLQQIDNMVSYEGKI